MCVCAHDLQVFTSSYTIKLQCERKAAFTGQKMEMKGPGSEDALSLYLYICPFILSLFYFLLPSVTGLPSPLLEADTEGHQRGHHHDYNQFIVPPHPLKRKEVTHD